MLKKVRVQAIKATVNLLMRNREELRIRTDMDVEIL